MKNTICALSITVSVLLYSCNNSSKHAAQNTNPVVINNGVKIAYTDNGDADTTLLFVHGWCINKSYWANQVNLFSKKYRVITIDLPGFGQSGKNRNIWDVATYASDVKAVIDQLDLKNVILIGHSMAGDIILDAALRSPKKVIAIVGVDNFKDGHITTDQVQKTLPAFLDRFKLHFKTTASKYFTQTLFYKTTDSALQKRIINDVIYSDSLIAVASLKGVIEQLPFEAPKLLQLHKKLYLINSDYTPTDTLSLKTKNIPYQVKYIHATGHFPMIEKPGDFNSALTQIMSDIK